MTGLTNRQRQVCRYLCLGWSNRDIAAKLDLSHRTIETHREVIFKKFKVRNVVELVREVYHIADEVVT